MADAFHGEVPSPVLPDEDSHSPWTDFRGLRQLQGSALTARLDNLDELSRVQQLHQQLGYPRTPLLHAFLAKRI